MKATKTIEMVAVDRVYDLEDAPAVRLDYRTTDIEPAVAVAVFEDGKFASLRLSGPRLRKDGTPGAAWSEMSYWRTEDVPEWARTLTVYEEDPRVSAEERSDDTKASDLGVEK